MVAISKYDIRSMLMQMQMQYEMTLKLEVPNVPASRTDRATGSAKE